MYCKKCGTPLEDGQAFCQVCGTRQTLIPSPTVSSPVVPRPSNTAEPSMKWHRFLVLAGLWIYVAFTLAEGLYYTVGGINLLLNPSYRFSWDNLLPLIYGLGLLVPAILAIFARPRLAKFRKTGVSLLRVLAETQILAGICMASLWSSILEPDHPMVLLNLLRIILSFVLLEANRFYFEKRKEKFL